MSKQPEPQQSLTKEQIETALAERRALSTLAAATPKEPAGIAPAEVLASERATARYVEPPRPAAPPAPEVQVGPIEKLRAAKLAEIEAKVERRQAVKVELAEQQKNQAALIEQMKRDEAALAAESEALEAEVGQIQRELAAVEAQHLAKAALRDQAARGETERLPLKAWQAEWRKAILPLQQRIVGGLGKLQATLRDRGATLETVAALRSQPGLDNETRSTFIAVSTTAGNLLTEIHDAIVAHERALAHAEDFQPDPSSPDGVSAINGLRYELETVTGVTTGKLVDLRNPRVVIPAGVGVEGSTPAAVNLEQRTAELLTQYAAVQKKANRTSRPTPTITIEILPKGEKPRSQVMAEQRGPSKDTFDPTQTTAEGVN
jgi:hypothetical protein